MRSFSGLIETMRGGAPSFPMKFNIRRAIVAVSLVASAPFASATVLNFDDLAGGGFMPVYQGFTFNGWFHNAFTGTPHLAKSPEQAIHLDSSVPANSITNGSTFTFEGAYFSGYDFAVRFELYSGGSLVHTSDSLNPSFTPTWLASGFAGKVDEVRLATDRPGYAVMDDVTVNSVPEPETWALMVAGLAFFGLMSRRRKS